MAACVGAWAQYTATTLEDTGLHAIDISNPVSPVRVCNCDTSSYALDIAISGNYAYVANGHNGLQVIDISNPANPAKVGNYNTGGYSVGVAVSGNYVYVATMENGLVVCHVDMTPPVDVTINDAKKQVDNTRVNLSEAVITAFGDGYFYIENENRTSGIRVELEQHSRDVGDIVEILGIMKTDENGERYISASSVETTGIGSIAPLGMTNKALGGGDFGNPATGVGQRGATGGTGLNNIGLLVRTTGAVSYIDAHTFTIDDGSGVNIRCEMPFNILASTAWQYVAVSGISSIVKNADAYDRLLRVTSVQPIHSGAPEGVTGRWVTTRTSCPGCGDGGALLSQCGSEITSTTIGITEWEAHIEGNRITGYFIRGDGERGDFFYDHNGDELTGELTIYGSTIPHAYHRVSPDPVSPYIGRPKVLSATCDGTAIDITWDRPVGGGTAFAIIGQGIFLDAYECCDYDQSFYDPSSNSYHLALLPTVQLIPGFEYTVFLGTGNIAYWTDPYGVPAWDSPTDAYSFVFTLPGTPPEPPAWVFGGEVKYGDPPYIRCQWPNGAASLRLYESADGVNWSPTSIVFQQRNEPFVHGEAIINESNGYYRVTSVGWSGEESLPSEVVHARPSEIEQYGVAIEYPSDGQTNIPTAPTFRWHPNWQQSASVKYYVLDVDTMQDSHFETTWITRTTDPSAPTSVTYGQTQGVETWLAAPGPLSPNEDCFFLICAIDTENWIFASGRNYFSTGLGSISCRSAKALPDGSWVHIKNRAVVTASRTNDFYIEDPNRSSGILVMKQGHGFTKGMRVSIEGPINTLDSGERYIQAQYTFSDSQGTIEPLGITNRALGGGDWNYLPGYLWPNTLGGQVGVKDGFGLNNIGLLVRVWGRVTAAGVNTNEGFAWGYVDDGSNIEDGSGYKGVYWMAPAWIALPQIDSYISITGISSCRKLGDNIVRKVNVPYADGIVKIAGPP